MTGFRHNRSWKFAAVIVVLIVIVAGVWPISVLEVSEQGGDPGLVIPLIHEKKFDYEYIHSVQKTPVQEHFVLAPENKLLLTSTTYQSFGVGLPFMPDEGELAHIDGKYVLTGLNRSYDTVHMGIISLAFQDLSYHGKRYDLCDYFESGTMLEIKARNYSPAKLIWTFIRGS